MMATAEPREARYDRTRREHQHQWLITKLRWMGLEHEADQMTAACETPACMTEPAETD
ncbi:MAG: hypothetical protein KGJ66_04740 [Alphaproteobacteria bacterium]|nr:hypothetical protein [Alphaproteobacteria bacterium]